MIFAPWLAALGCGSDAPGGDVDAGRDASGGDRAAPDASDASSDATAPSDTSPPSDASGDAPIDAPIDTVADVIDAADAPLTDAAGPDAPIDSAPDAAPCLDLDGDGYGTGAGCLGLDCDDTNPFVSPAMQELADDGVDNDCAGGALVASVGPGVYVDVQSASCSDAALGHGSKAVPYCSIEMAVIEAQSANVDRAIFVAKGTYPNTVGFATNMRLYGGYDPAAWTYDPALNETVIGGGDHLDSLDGTACRNGAGCSASCVCVDYDGWVSINAAARAVFQGFTIRGGKRPGAPIFGLTINSSAQVTVAYSNITAGQGIQTVAVQIPGTATNVLLYENVIDAGTPTSSSAFGVNNLGVATLFGNRIGCGPGSSTSFATAVQNYKTMRLVANVINPGDDGSGTATSAGFHNNVLQSTPATAIVLNNAIFGGRGTESSIGLLNAGIATIANNVLGGRTPTGGAWANRATGESDALLIAFSGTTKLHANSLFTPTYAGEPSPPNAGANRHAMHDAQLAAFRDDASSINTCTWTGCQSSAGNVIADPTFLGSTDFHIAPGSPLRGIGIDVTPFLPIGPARVDIDGTIRPVGGWDIGIDEIP